MKKTVALLLLLVTAAPYAPAADTTARRSPTHADIWLMKRLGAPVVSPDGNWIVLSVVEPAYDEAAQLSDLWLVNVRNGYSSRRLTSTRRAETGVVWSPDSRRIAFTALRDDDEAPQVYVLDLAAGGEAHRITSLSGGGRSPVWSHDGRQIAFVSLMYADAPDEATNRRRLEARRARKTEARIYEGFPIRNWDRWLDERQVRVFVQPLDEDGFAAGPPRDLLARTRLATSKGFAGRLTDVGEEVDMEFTPDNQALLFTASTNRNTAAYSFTDSQIFMVDVQGGEPRALTSGMSAWSRPLFTPDGKTLLALVESRGGNIYNPAKLAAFAWPDTRKPRIVTASIDRAVESYAVSPDSRTVYFTAEDAGHEKLFSVAIGGGAVRTLFGVGKGSYSNLVIPAAAGGLRLYANWESASDPGELALISAGNGRAKLVTRFNVGRAGMLDLPPIEHFWFTSSRGKRIHNILVRPPGFDPLDQYPLVVLIHGGPHGMWRDQFFVRWNYHLIAAGGYVLLLTNYSGSTGFGEEFALSIKGDPLKGPADEINEAADAAIRQFRFIDGTRQCAGGASYGGHLSNWLQGTTTRYRCLLSHAGLVNLESQWGTSDTIYAREVNLGGPPWEQAPVWSEQNPIRLAANFRTPVLVTIGELDYRVPLNNSLEYWAALQRMKVPSRLIVFPDENHWILKGENSRLFYAELDAWLSRWLAPGR